MAAGIDGISDKEFNMVELAIMSLLITLCLERNSVNLQTLYSELELVTRESDRSDAKAHCFRQ